MKDLPRAIQSSFEYFKTWVEIHGIAADPNKPPASNKSHTHEQDLLWALVSAYPGVELSVINKLFKETEMLMHHEVLRILQTSNQALQSRVVDCILLHATGYLSAQHQVRTIASAFVKSPYV